jgi:hypothetical protein
VKKLFDENGFLILDEIVFESNSYKAILDDKIISDDEVIEQSDKVIGLLRKMETQLSESDLDLAVEAICEIAVLYEINSQRGGN